MLIRILSDLHLERNYFEYSNCNEDVIILAGDIATAATHDTFEEFIISIPNIIKIIFIPGNHEYYHGVVSREKEFFKRMQDTYNNFHYLDNSHVDIHHDGNFYSFFGGIMCSNFALYGNIESAKSEAFSFINDFYLINENERYRWSTKDHVLEFKNFKKDLIIEV